MRSFAIDRAVHERHERRIAFREFARIENARRYNRQRGFIINPYAFGAGGPTDPNFANVVLLLHLDGSDNSTTITDSSSFTQTCTAQGTAVLKVAQARYGASSAFINVSSSSLDKIVVTHHASLNLPGDFTIEASVYWAGGPDGSLQSPGFFAKRGGASEIEYWFLYFSGSLYFFWTTDGTSFNSVNVTWSPSTGQWYDVALSRVGSNGYFLVNGTQQGSTQTISGTIFSGSQNACVFTDNQNAATFNGYLDEIRVTESVGRYNASGYTPAAFPDS